MHYKLNDLAGKSGDLFIQAFKDIPKETSSLDISKSSLFKRPVAEIIEAFKYLPAGLGRLDAGNNGLGHKPTVELIQIFTAIPATNLSVLNVTKNGLGQKIGHDFTKIINSFPKTLHTLNLQDNALGNMFGAKLVEVSTSIPENITTLDLGNNDLGTRNAADVIDALRSFHKNLTTLGLSNNMLHEMFTPELATVFEALPPNIKNLDLKSNVFGKKPGIEFAATLDAIPETVESLDLSWNHLGNNDHEELNNIFDAIPPGVTSLYLNNNNFFKNDPPAVLIEALSYIPEHVRFIDLNQHKPLNKTPDELVQILVNVPDTVKKVLIDKKCINLKRLREIATLEQMIDSEITRLQPSRSIEGSFLVSFGLVESSDTKIKAYEDLRAVLYNGALADTDLNDFQNNINSWLTNNRQCITRQRNTFHSFFEPGHKTLASKAVNDIFDMLSLMDTAFIRPQLL